MDWNFELTEQAALALYAKKYRQEKASGRLLRAIGIIGVAVGLWFAMEAGQAMLRPGYFYDEFDPVGGALYVVLAAVLLVLSILVFWKSRARGLAAAVLRRQKKLGASPLGQWRVHLDEEKLLTVRAGLQEASDPSVVQKVEQYPEGLLVHLYGGAKMLALPAPAFDGPDAMKAAAAQFERCAALAKARLYEESARQTAGEQEGRVLPPCPPLPEIFCTRLPARTLSSRTAPLPLTTVCSSSKRIPGQRISPLPLTTIDKRLPSTAVAASNVEEPLSVSAASAGNSTSTRTSPRTRSPRLLSRESIRLLPELSVFTLFQSSGSA